MRTAAHWWSLTDGPDSVLNDPAYVAVVRVSHLTRLIILAITVFFDPTDKPIAWLLIATLGAISLVCSRGERLTVLVMRHPSLAVLDAAATTGLLLAAGANSPVALTLVVSALLVGLLFRRRFAVPLATILVAGALVAPGGVLDPVSSGVLMGGFGLPLLSGAATLIGHTMRRSYQRASAAQLSAAQALAAANAADERARLARDLHDSVGKSLHGIGLASAALPALVANQPTEAVQVSRSIAAAAEQAAAEARAILVNLRRGQLDRPLAEAVSELCQTWETDNGIPLAFTADGVVDVRLDLARQIYAVVSESLHNIARHARADSVQVRLHQDGEDVAVTISDDGVGFSPDQLSAQQERGHFGIQGLHERAADVNGSCVIETRPGAGTTIVWSAPR